MLDFHQKRKIRAVIYARVTLVILSIIVLIMLHSTWVVFQKKGESERMKNISEKNIESLKLRQSELKSKIDRLETPSGLEEEIRSKFTVAKSGENMVVVVDNSEGPTSTTSSMIGFWQRFWDLFKK